MRIAGIDIGTNTILMTIADYDGNDLTIIRDEHSLARLGQDLNKTGIISEQAISRAVKILENYKAICENLKVEYINAAGTSALRDANNSSEVLKVLSTSLNNNIKVLSGSEEAKISFLGTIEDDHESMVVDIGGGSTEIIHGKETTIYNHISIQMGAVRLAEKYLLPHPPEPNNIQSAIKSVRHHLDSVKFGCNDCILYAVAGTPTTLAAISLGLKDYEREKVHLYKLNLHKINQLVDLLFKTKLEDIIENFGVNPMRADVISAGSLILKLVIEKLGKDSVIVSANGLRFGLIKSVLKNFS